MALKESGEMYLETILILKEEKGNVRSIDIANELGYSKPSVSRAIGILKRDSYINVDAHGNITLTTIGSNIAKTIYYRHQTISSFLIKIGVSEECSLTDACKMEHIISEETMSCIENYLKNA
ncbi:MAG: metal-dependent transcriptional regulator [Anaerovoracaceae bacterium]